MKFTPIEHRSEEWFQLRLGMPTASQFDRIMTPAKGELSKQRHLYAGELIGERIFKRPMSKDLSGIPAAEHGIETEPEAARKLQEILGDLLLSGGFMTDDRGRYGCSADRQIISGNRREVIEIKCPQIPQHIANLLYGLDDKYQIQIQGQLLISEYDRAYFFSYHPLCPPRLVKVERDEVFIRKLARALDQFCEELEEDYQKALKAGKWVTS